MKNCTYLLRTVLILCLLAASGVLPSYSQLVQTPKMLNVSNGDAIGFLEYKPADYDKKNTRYPVIIFLHGIGERGNGTTELTKVNCCGIPRMISYGHPMTFKWNGKTETFLVIAPQCPKKYGMWPTVVVDELVRYAKNNLHSDTNRIFLTGLSMGGGGTYRYISTAQKNAESIAAAATICAPCTFDKGANVANAKLPLWSFHAADDNVAKYTCTEDAINKVIWANPAVKPLKTIWPTGGHIVWDRVYTDTSYKFDGVLNIYEWFLGQNKSLPVNKLPVANAGNRINTSAAVGMVTLNASASTDADGKIVRYVWKKISGPVAGLISTVMGTSATTTVTGLTIAGTYQYELAVVDDRAGFSRDTVTVTVNTSSSLPPANILPVARAGKDIDITLPVSAAAINGSYSSDADGSVAIYNWTKVSGPSLNFVNHFASYAVLTNLREGTYVIKLTVTDNRGATAEDLVTLTVNPAPKPAKTDTIVNNGSSLPVANLLPVAEAGNDITVTLPKTSVAINGTNSFDTDGSVAVYNWTKVSGPSMDFVNHWASYPVLKNLTEGVYVIRLTVTDNKGGTSEDQVTITVKSPQKTPQSLQIANSISAAPAQTALGVYPNPSRTSINVEMNNDTTGNVQISIYNSSAMIVHSCTARKEQRHFVKNIGIGSLKPGLYYIEANIEGKKRVVSKFVKQI